MSAPFHEDLDTLAALHVLDLLEGEERTEFEALLRDSEQARSALAAAQRTVAALLEIAPARRPPETLRERLLARIRSEPARPPAPGSRIELSPGLLLVLAGRLDWQDTGVPGVRVKPLYVDESRHYASHLVTMAAGSVYPRHSHAQLEELFMVSGSLSVAGHRLAPGDYCRAEAGTVHDEVQAETDCSFIVLSGLDNEFRPAK